MEQKFINLILLKKRRRGLRSNFLLTLHLFRPKLIFMSDKDNNLLILEQGRYYTDGGWPVVAARTKEKILEYIKENFPNHKNSTDDTRMLYKELFFENDEEKTWLKCRLDYRIPLEE